MPRSCPLSCRFTRLIEIIQIFVFLGFDIDPFHWMVRPPARLEARPIRDRYRRQCFECLDQAKASVRSIPGRRDVFRRCPDRFERVPFLVDRNEDRAAINPHRRTRRASVIGSPPAFAATLATALRSRRSAKPRPAACAAVRCATRERWPRSPVARRATAGNTTGNTTGNAGQTARNNAAAGARHEARCAAD